MTNDIDMRYPSFVGIMLHESDACVSGQLWVNGHELGEFEVGVACFGVDGASFVRVRVPEGVLKTDENTLKAHVYGLDEETDLEVRLESLSEVFVGWGVVREFKFDHGQV